MKFEDKEEGESAETGILQLRFYYVGGKIRRSRTDKEYIKRTNNYA